MKVLLTSTSFQDTPGEHQKLLERQGFQIDRLRGPIKEADLLPIIAEYDAVICGDDEYTDAVLKKGAEGRLRFLSKYGVGLDKIDLMAAKKYGIPVTNCPGVNQISVAEHVLALLFTFEKNVHLQYNSTQAGSWKRWVGHELYGKTIGIIGLGAIGKELALRTQALGLHTLVFDLHPNNQFLTEYPSIQPVDSPEEIFSEADYISLHIPLTDDNEGLIDENVIFSKFKKCPVLVNTSRGRLVNSEAVLKGLEAGKLRGYLADVLAEEPIAQNEVLRGKDRIVITPHVGSRTFESVQRQGLMAVENLLKMIRG